MDNIFRIGNIKRFAKQAMRGKWIRGFIVMLLFAVIQSGPSFILSYVTNSPVVAYLLAIYRLAISGPLLMGVTVFFLDCFRGTEEPGLGSFGRGFSFGVRAMQLFIICFALVFLWSLLFVIPGIIAAIRYSQSFFILADEPTGALDTETTGQIMGVFKELNEKGKTVIIVTHDPQVAEQCERIIEISDGKIVGQE